MVSFEAAERTENRRRDGSKIEAKEIHFKIWKSTTKSKVDKSDRNLNAATYDTGNLVRKASQR